jgi:hypothetical protein
LGCTITSECQEIMIHTHYTVLEPNTHLTQTRQQPSEVGTIITHLLYLSYKTETQR